MTAPTFADYLARSAASSRQSGGRRRNAAGAGPRVSVVTVVRNGAATLERTVRSVLAQTYAPIEYIVVDGASTDATLDIIRRHEAGIDYWMSEPDRGIADAWNKGLAASTGEIVAILNADDQYLPETVERAVRALTSSGAELAYGRVELVDAGQNLVKAIDGQWRSSGLYAGIGFLHPSCFALRSAYARIGLFDTTYKYAMDADWLIRLHQAGGRFVRHDGVTRMRADGVSNRHWRATRDEYLRALERNGVAVPQRWLARAYAEALALRKQGAG